MRHLYSIITFIILFSFSTYTSSAEEKIPTKNEILKLLRHNNTEQFEAYCKQYPNEIFVYALNNPTIAKSFYNIFECPYHKLLPAQLTMSIDACEISLFKITQLSQNISICEFYWGSDGSGGTNGIIATFRNNGKFIDAISLFEIIEESYIVNFMPKRINNLNSDEDFMISAKYHSNYNITADSILVKRTIKYNISKLEGRNYTNYKYYLMCDEDFSYYFTPDGKIHLKAITFNENNLGKISNEFYLSDNNTYTFSDLMRDFSFGQLRFLPFSAFPSKTNILRLIKYNEIGYLNLFTIRNPEKMFRLIMSDSEVADGVCKNWLEYTSLGGYSNTLNDVIETITDKQFKQQVIEFLTGRGINLTEDK